MSKFVSSAWFPFTILILFAALVYLEVYFGIENQLRLPTFSTLIGFIFISTQIRIFKESEVRKMEDKAKDERKRLLQKLIDDKKESLFFYYRNYRSSIQRRRHSITKGGIIKHIEGIDVIRFFNEAFYQRSTASKGTNTGQPLHVSESVQAYDSISDYNYSFKKNKYKKMMSAAAPSVENTSRLWENFDAIYQCYTNLDLYEIFTLYIEVESGLVELNGLIEELDKLNPSECKHGPYTLYFSYHEQFLFEITKKLSKFKESLPSFEIQEIP